MRAGTLISVRRRVAVVALARVDWPVSVPAARVRLKAMTARVSQAAFAANFPEGMCASAESFRSACTFSMIARSEERRVGKDRWSWGTRTDQKRKVNRKEQHVD